MNTKLSLLWGLIIFIISGILFYFSNNTVISVFYIFIAMFCGAFLIIFRKDIPVFSPIFMLISSIFINIGFPALYLFMSKPPFSEELLKNIAVIYLIYFFALILPVFFAGEMFTFSKPSDNKKIGIFKINFNSANINFYFIASNILIVFLVWFLLKTTGFTYAEAFQNPLEFRFYASAGSLAYLRKLVILMFMLNTFLIAKYSFCNDVVSELFAGNLTNNYKKQNPLKLKFFTVLHIVLLFLFTLISGSRSVLFLPVASAIAVYIFYNRLNIKTAVSVVLIFLLTLVTISVYGYYRNHSDSKINSQFITESLNKINICEQTADRLDNFKNSLYFFEYAERENNTIFYFEDFRLFRQMKNHFLQFMPRDLFPDKAYYFSSQITSMVFNSGLSGIKTTYNFGGAANAFWNFGIAGVIIEGLLLGIAVVWLHGRFLQYLYYDSFFLFFMTTFFFIPNSIIVDGFWNTMDGCGYFLNIAAVTVVVGILSFGIRHSKLDSQT